ncbi:hypothetical protein [Streptomyces microflavus]|uniref:hypothetical protein n=1 Tax=Streptomyces microflavus TaxID=1919 RepID=UPI00362BD02A
MTLAEKLKAKKAERDLWKEKPIKPKKKPVHTPAQKKVNKEAAKGWATYLIKRIEAEEKAEREAYLKTLPKTCTLRFQQAETPDCVVDWDEIQIRSVAHKAQFFYL